MSHTNNLTQNILRILNYSGYKAWRNNNHGVYSVKRKSFMKNPTTLLGVSDILGFHKETGRMLAIEVKTGKDKLSQHQELFLEDVKKAGGLSLVARDLPQFEIDFRIKNILINPHRPKFNPIAAH